MSTPFSGSAEPPPPSPITPAPVVRRRRPAVIAAIALGGIAAVTAIALGASAVWGGGPTNSKTSTTIAEPSVSPAEEPADPVEPTDPVETAEPAVDYSATPTQTWRVAAADLMSGDPTASVLLASPDPMERPNRQGTVVLSAATDTLSSIVALDRATGEESWRIDLAPSEYAQCHTLAAGDSTACVVSSDTGAEESYRVLTLDSATGSVQGEDEIGFFPYVVTEYEGDLVLTGSALSTGAVHTTRGIATDLDARWHATSDEGYVPATEPYGSFQASDGAGWSVISGAFMLVDLATGSAESTPGDSGLVSYPWPGGTVLEHVDLGTGTARVIVTGPITFTADGVGWSRLGTSAAMESIVGVGDTAYDVGSGTPLWSATTDPEALGTNYTAIDDLALQGTWREESVTLTAFDLQTGEQRWQSSTRSALRLTRVGDALLADTSYGIEALHLATGERLWNLDYTDLMTTDAYDYSTMHTIAGASVVTTFDNLVTGYTFEP